MTVGLKAAIVYNCSDTIDAHGHGVTQGHPPGLANDSMCPRFCGTALSDYLRYLNYVLLPCRTDGKANLCSHL